MLNWFLGCMAFFNVNFETNEWWAYAIGAYLGVVASQQMLVALIYADEEKERVTRRIQAINQEDIKEEEEEKERQRIEEEEEMSEEDSSDGGKAKRQVV